jgi:hypothetical protein
VAPAVAGRVSVPTACALFPKEITMPPRKWVEANYNLVRWTEMPRGGHFAALEQPELLVDDVRAFFGRCAEASEKRFKLSRHTQTRTIQHDRLEADS